MNKVCEASPDQFPVSVPIKEAIRLLSEHYESIFQLQ